jgi:hypothetical protein
VAERAYQEEAVGFQATWMLLGDTGDMDDIVEAILKVQENVDELTNF